MIKQKSLIVALISSFIIALVLVLTLIGYLVYIELKGEEFRRSYQVLLQKANAKVYSKYIEIPDLSAKIENAGALKGKPVIEGILKNKGSRNISSVLVKVKFLDRDGAILYDVSFHPQDPSLGTSVLPQVSIPYLLSPARTPIKPDGAFPFKIILASCPLEIITALKKGAGYVKGPARWSGKLVFEANDGDQQIRNHRCPHLPKHRIDAPSHEFIHLKISLQRLEEKFHLPPCFVKITDRLGS